MRRRVKKKRLTRERLENRDLLASVTLEPTIDNSLYEDDSGVISNGEGAFLFSGKTGGRGGEKLRRALVKFDVADQIPAGATVTSVALQLNVSLSPRNESEQRTMSLHRVLSDWGEGSSNAGDPGGEGTSAANGDATWIHRKFPGDSWDTPGGDYEAAVSASTDVGLTGFHTWTDEGMVNDVAAWLADPGSNFGWILIGDENATFAARRFDSRENGNADNRPKLTIEYEEVATTTISISPASVQEGNEGSSSIQFEVSLSETPTETVTVQYTTQDGDAIAGEDYAAESDTLTFDPGVDQLSIEIEVFGDVTTESDESFNVTFEQATNAEIDIASAAGTIENDDPVPTLLVEAMGFPEDEQTANASVSISNPSAFPIQVNYSTANETAEAGDDYADQSGVIEFAPGETTQSLALSIMDDDRSEGSETFRVDFDSPVNVSISDSLVVEILDDDVPTAPWHNGDFPEDVDGDGSVIPFDALLIINELNDGLGPGPLTQPGEGQPPPFLDVDGDNILAPFDVLLVINYLNDPPLPARPAEPFVAQASDIVAAIEFVFSDDERNKRIESCDSDVANQNVATQRMPNTSTSGRPVEKRHRS